MIYVLDAVGANLIKIGYTEQLIEKRIAALQTGCPHKLQLIAVMPGDREDEKIMHKIGEPWRVPWTREWFSKTWQLLHLIGAAGATVNTCLECGAKGANIDADPPTGSWVCGECHGREIKVFNFDLIEVRP
jgi:hypothetical protein